MDTTAPPVGYIQAQPPPVMVASNQQQSGAGGAHHSGGHFGPVIGVLAVIAVLGILAGLLGRLCSGRTILGYGPHFDVEAWVETKCSSCLDGHVSVPVVPRQLPPQLHPHMAMETHPTIPSSGGLNFRPHHVGSKGLNPEAYTGPPLHINNNVSLHGPIGPPPQHPHPPPQHLQRHPQPSPRPGPGPGPGPGPSMGPEMEVHLRPLPMRQVSMGEIRGGGDGGEPEITAAEEQGDRRRKQPVVGTAEDVDAHDDCSCDEDDEMSDSTDHDELQHRRRREHHQIEGGGSGGDEEELPHQQRH